MNIKSNENPMANVAMANRNRNCKKNHENEKRIQEETACDNQGSEIQGAKCGFRI